MNWSFHLLKFEIEEIEAAKSSVRIAVVFCQLFALFCGLLVLVNTYLFEETSANLSSQSLFCSLNLFESLLKLKDTLLGLQIAFHLPFQLLLLLMFDFLCLEYDFKGLQHLAPSHPVNHRPHFSQFLKLCLDFLSINPFFDRWLIDLITNKFAHSIMRLSLPKQFENSLASRKVHNPFLIVCRRLLASTAFLQPPLVFLAHFLSPQTLAQTRLHWHF